MEERVRAEEEDRQIEREEGKRRQAN